MPAQAKLSLWKRVFLTNKDLETSNLHLNKIKKFSGHSVTLLKSFEEISKNVGVSFLILDPTESQLQIVHHGHVLRGNWSSLTKKLVTILGADPEAKPIHIAQKLIKNIKEKSFCFDEFAANVDKEEDFTNLDVPNLDFQFKNILPIPIFLMKVFIQLQSTTPHEVAKAFIRSISDLESSQTLVDTSNSPDDMTTEEDREMEGDLADINHETDLPLVQTGPSNVIIPDDILYAIQICHLCTTGKIPPVLYSLSSDQETSNWFKSIQQLHG